MRCKKAVQQSQTSRTSSPAGNGTAGSVTPGCCCCLWGVHGDTHVHRAVLDSQDTNRFFQCRHGKHRASGTGIWQLSGISSERSGVPWELKSWQMWPTKGRATGFSCSDISASSPGAGQPLSRSCDVHWTHCCWEATPKLINPYPWCACTLCLLHNHLHTHWVTPYMSRRFVWQNRHLNKQSQNRGLYILCSYYRIFTEANITFSLKIIS